MKETYRRTSMYVARAPNAGFGLLRPLLLPVIAAHYHTIWPHDLREIERLVFENKETLSGKYHEYRSL
uniref:Uncharacterized protein n=1 Tax=Candidatus Kentrum sp. LFY TaxID=2126342 RepID=A0A450WKG7_9GAMM|nr:MAG: hypothetical protein BECKLFY1418C_GA0070996_103231 [Candidatus Kentron sp. LFY]